MHAAKQPRQQQQRHKQLLLPGLLGGMHGQQLLGAACPTTPACALQVAWSSPADVFQHAFMITRMYTINNSSTLCRQGA
jgi:hypothetical protein